MHICSGFIDTLYEEFDELVDLHPVVANVTQLVSVVEEDVGWKCIICGKVNPVPGLVAMGGRLMS